MKCKFLLLILFALMLSVTAYAHSGKTDAQGGHYDYSTGQYHYHHGYPAHQHYGGTCPYTSPAATTKATTQATTKATTKSTTQAAATTTAVATEKTEPEELVTTEATTTTKDYITYNEGFQKGKEKGYDEGYQKGRSAGYTFGKEAGYKEGYNDGVLAHPDFSVYEKKLEIWQIVACCLGIYGFVISIVAAVKIRNRNVLIVKHQEQVDEINKRVQALVVERDTCKYKQFVQNHEGAIVLPSSVKLEYECIPVTDDATPLFPYGRYTVFLNPVGRRFHRDPHCCESAIPIHEFRIDKTWKPCKKCGGYQPYIPDWYLDLSEDDCGLNFLDQDL